MKQTKKLISISRCHLIERKLLSDYYYSTAAEKKNENHLAKNKIMRIEINRSINQSIT